MKEGNNQAFPGGGYGSSATGLSKREELARSAMQGLLSKNVFDGLNVSVCKEGFVDPRTIAEFAVKYADALLEYMNKNT